MMGFHSKNWVGFLLLTPLFLIYSCGGGDESTTTPPPPTVTTTPATEITVHTASLNGTVNPNAQATTAVFEWGTDSALASPTTTTPQDIGAGTTDQPVNVTITGLTSGTTYYYRVAATNASGTKQGTIANFTTALPNSPPEVTTDAATSVTISEAVLNGTVNPNELATTAYFEYGIDATLASPTSTLDQPIGAGTTSVAITASLSGLVPGTTYYFRVVATNSAGTSEGTILSFDTVENPPTVTTAAPTSITYDSAILNGSVNPNGLAAEAHFEYGTDADPLTFSSTSTESLAAGFTVQPIIASLPGLTPETTYYFRVVATNSVGASEGTILSFDTVENPPTVTTAAPTSITYDSAILNGSVNPNGLAAEAHFEYGTDADPLTFSSTSTESLAAGFTVQPIIASLPGLTPETTYYFRVVATNSVDTSVGDIVSFITEPQPPTVAADVATSITTSSANLNGTVNPNGLETDAHFEYETDSALASPASTTTEAIGAGMTDVPITASLSGLIPGSTYYFRVVATSSAGTTEGQILSFNSNLFFDDFSTDTRDSYTSEGFDLISGNPSITPQFNYDLAGQQLEILTGDDLGLMFSSALPANDTGVFSFDFFPRATYPSGGGIWVRLMDEADNYYEIAAFEWDDELSPGEASRVTKWVGGAEVEENLAFTNVNNYVSQEPPLKYHVTITFTPTMTTLEAFGETIVLGTDTTSINVSKFEIQINQQDAYIDNIELLNAP